MKRKTIIAFKGLTELREYMTPISLATLTMIGSRYYQTTLSRKIPFSYPAVLITYGSEVRVTERLAWCPDFFDGVGQGAWSRECGMVGVRL